MDTIIWAHVNCSLLYAAGLYKKVVFRAGLTLHAARPVLEEDYGNGIRGN